MTDSIDLRMEYYKLQADLNEAQIMYSEKSRELDQKNNELKQKNDQIEEFQRIVEEQKKQIDSLKKERLNKELEEKEVAKEFSQNEINRFQKKVKAYVTCQRNSSKKAKAEIENIRNNVAQILEQLSQLEIDTDILPDDKEVAVDTAEISTQTDIVEEEIEKSEENTSVLIMGGRHLNTIYLLDSNVQSWKKLNITLPIAMRDFGAALVNNEIYIFGGWSNGSQQNCYKLKSDGRWMELASLNEKRCYISNSSVVYFGEIWVIGGMYKKSVEKYNILQNKWIKMPEMNQERSDAAAAVYKNKIIVTGGYNPVSEALNSVELFDPELQKWTLFCDISIKLYGHSMTITGSILTIYGGVSDSDRKGVWEMDIEDSEKKWTKKQDLKYARCWFGVAKLSNGIMAFGSAENETTEIFNGNNWIDGPKLPQKLLHFAFTPIPRSFEETFIQRFT